MLHEVVLGRPFLTRRPLKCVCFHDYRTRLHHVAKIEVCQREVSWLLSDASFVQPQLVLQQLEKVVDHQDFVPCLRASESDEVFQVAFGVRDVRHRAKREANDQDEHVDEILGDQEQTADVDGFLDDLRSQLLPMVIEHGGLRLSHSVKVSFFPERLKPSIWVSHLL